MDLQTILALAIVAVTAALFTVRAFRRKAARGSCGNGCNCPAGLQLHGQSDILKASVQKTDQTK